MMKRIAIVSFSIFILLIGWKWAKWEYGLWQIRQNLEPSVLLILGTSHTSMGYGFEGNQEVKTPHLDKLAASGLYLKNGYIPSDDRQLAIKSILSGYSPENIRLLERSKLEKFIKVEQPDSIELKRQKERLKDFSFRYIHSLPRELSEGDYVSFQSGIWHEGSYKDGGFTHGLHSGNKELDTVALVRDGYKPYEDFVDKWDDHALFTLYAPLLKEESWEVPADFIDLYEKSTMNEAEKKEAALLSWFDHSVGELLQILEDEGRLENTVVLFMDINSYKKAPHLKNQAEYDLSQIHSYKTPVIINWPNKINVEKSDRLFYATDVAPTVLGLLDKNKPVEMDGLDYFSDRPRTEIISTIADGDKIVGSWLRTDDYFLIEDKNYGENYLINTGDFYKSEKEINKEITEKLSARIELWNKIYKIE